MSVRDLVILPDSQLRLKSADVTAIDEQMRKLVEDMFETQYKAPGIGLAAIQIGVPLRVVTIDIAREDEPKAPLALINPEITWTSEETSVYEEGCLSIPDYYAEVTRPAKIRFNFLNLEGNRIEMDADGLLATCVQHELDHLNGVLFIDHISKLKRDRVIKKFTKLAKEREM